MRAKTTLVLSALLLMLSVLSVAQPAAATPAQPFNVSECFSFGELEYCYTVHGVFQVTETPSGNTKYIYNVTSSYTVTENGQVVYSEEDRYHANYLVKDGESQVAHNLGSGSFPYANQTCTYDYNVIFTDGEVRHEVFNFQCS